MLSLDYYTWVAFFVKINEFSGATNVDISTSKIWNRFWANENIFKKLFFFLRETEAPNPTIPKPTAVAVLLKDN